MKPCSPLKSTWGISTICDIKLDLFYVLLFLLLTCFFTTGTQGSTRRQASSKVDFKLLIGFFYAFLNLGLLENFEGK